MIFKKAFTLVELLVVVMVLGIVVAIAVPVISSVISDSRQSAFDTQIDLLKNSAHQYSITNSLGKENGVYKALFFEELINEGLIKEEPINPLTSEKLEGCIIYAWKDEINQYDFQYSEECDVVLADLNISLSSSVAVNDRGWITSSFSAVIDTNATTKYYCVTESNDCEPTTRTNSNPTITDEGNITICALGTRGEETTNKVCKSYKVDTIKPVAGTLSITGTKGLNDWYISNVNIAMTNGTDIGSGHESTTVNVENTEITENTRGQNLIVTTTDIAGNSTTNEYLIKIDKNTPTISAKATHTSIIEEQDKEFENFYNLQYGLSDGALVCNYQNTNTLIGNQDYNVSCKAVGNNGLESNEVAFNLEVFKCDIANPTSDEYFLFDKVSGVITGYSNSGPKDVIIPCRIDGVEVETIGASAFRSKELTSVLIPNSVRQINNYAFYINNLTNVDIPSSVNHIGGMSFNDNLLNENDAFIYTRNIDGSINNTNVISYGGAKKDNVEIPANVTTLSNSSFNGNGLNSVIIPETVISIGVNTFSNNNLTGNDQFIYMRKDANKDGIAEIDTSVLIGYGGASKNIIIPEGVISLGIQSLFGLGLESVILPESLVYINTMAFYANDLSTIDFPDSVTYIGHRAFHNNNLTEVTVADTVTFLGTGAFNDNLLPFDNAFFYKRTDSNKDGIAEIDNSIVYSYGGIDKNITLPSNIKKIEGSSFTESGLTSVNIPSTVTEIVNGSFNKNYITGESAFLYKRTDTNNDGIAEIDDTVLIGYGYWSSENVVIPEGVEEIGLSAFGVSYAQNITLPETLRVISQAAFTFTSINSITIPANVEYLGEGMFNGSPISKVFIEGKTDMSQFDYVDPNWKPDYVEVEFK